MTRGSSAAARPTALLSLHVRWASRTTSGCLADPTRPKSPVDGRSLMVRAPTCSSDCSYSSGAQAPDRNGRQPIRIDREIATKFVAQLPETFDLYARRTVGWSSPGRGRENYT